METPDGSAHGRDPRGQPAILYMYEKIFPPQFPLESPRQRPPRGPQARETPRRLPGEKGINCFGHLGAPQLARGVRSRQRPWSLVGGRGWRWPSAAQDRRKIDEKSRFSIQNHRKMIFSKFVSGSIPGVPRRPAGAENVFSWSFHFCDVSEIYSNCLGAAGGRWWRDSRGNWGNIFSYI